MVDSFPFKEALKNLTILDSGRCRACWKTTPNAPIELAAPVRSHHLWPLAEITEQIAVTIG